MRLPRRGPPWGPERLAYWYFRLNGFLTTENFIVHPDEGRDQRTDADLLAVRFANRAENLERPMQDDPRFSRCQTHLNVVIAEVKTGQCALNGPWLRPEEGNMERVLAAIGCVLDEDMPVACEALHGHGIWSDANLTIRLFALGESQDDVLIIPQEQQVTWDEVIAFCVERFITYRQEKSSVGQWTEDGVKLRNLALSQEAHQEIRAAFNLRTADEVQAPRPVQ